ncbi:unnamed protein product [Ceratitis capitata]|uniref:(Mediterranean fruit fly) hypothetical protein n=1 Tax=Ceratitis capitata TaxID=7213 RepID=A0A811U940_CERCA|nr:unnamed protein product [Ceratitis capitata]
MAAAIAAICSAVLWSTSVSPKTHVATLDLKHSIHLFPKFNILEVNVQAKQLYFRSLKLILRMFIMTAEAKLFVYGVHSKSCNINIGPSFVHLHLKSSLFGQIEILQTITPVEPLIQKVVHRFYAQKFFGPLIKLMIFAESVMFERDIVMWNNKTYRSKPQLVKEDAAIKNFRNWFSQFYTENSKSFLESRSALDW